MWLLDSPVSGGEAGAVAATLSIMVGGDPGAVERARPVLETVGRTVVHVGPSGTGQIVKAANQLVVAAHLQALGEAVVFLEAHGVDVDAGLDVLAGGLAGSAVLEQKRDNVRDRSFEPGARMALHQGPGGLRRGGPRGGRGDPGRGARDRADGGGDGGRRPGPRPLRAGPRRRPAQRTPGVSG